MIAWILGLLLLMYVGVVLRIWFAWVTLPSVAHKNGHYSPTAFVSVVVAARNEAQALPNLINALARQRYPASLFEVLVVDDHSTDNTIAVAEQAAKAAGLANLRCITLTEAAGGKKAAIATGIAQAKGTYICTTDADCAPGPGWLLSMVQEAETTKAVFISGPVCYTPSQSMLSKLQAVEFAGLIAIGGATIYLGQPTMCNGANLLFGRDAFYKVNGYAGNEEIASGDDEFLLHKIAASFPDKYRFLKSEEAIVFTQPKATLAGLMQQRIRWAGKWKHYQRQSPKALAVFIAVVYAGLLFGLFSALAGWISFWYLISVFCIKFVVEALFFASTLRFFKQIYLLWLVVALQVVQPLFVLAVAFFTLRGRYKWKGRIVYAP